MLFRLNDYELYGIFVFNVREVLVKSRLDLPSYSVADAELNCSDDFTLDLFDLLGKSRPEDEKDVFIIKTEFNGRKQSFVSGVVEEIIDFDSDSFINFHYLEELSEFGGARVSVGDRVVNILDLQVFLDNYIAVNPNPYSLNIVSSSKMVVVVDSSLKNRMILRDVFEKLGLSVFTFSDALFAEKFMSKLPDKNPGDGLSADICVLIMAADLYSIGREASLLKLKFDFIFKKFFSVVHSSNVGKLADSSAVDCALADFCPVKLRDNVLLRMSRL